VTRNDDLYCIPPAGLTQATCIHHAHVAHANQTDDGVPHVECVEIRTASRQGVDYWREQKTAAIRIYRSFQSISVHKKWLMEEKASLRFGK